MGIVCDRKNEVDMKPIKNRSAIAMFLLLGAIMVLIARVNTKEHVYSTALEKEAVEIEPIRVEKIDEATDKYYFILQDIDETNNTLLFYTNHQEVMIHVGDRLLYSLEKENSVFGRTPGAMWNIVSLPVGTEEISIVTRQAYPSLAKQDITFEIGNAIPMQREVVVGSIIDVCICFHMIYCKPDLLHKCYEKML